ncbi:MAG: hypothetical protein KY397_05345, partial [Gemmatimonadetes bacterium]|nr:hypothetical protein [Gemmatimonadota bacterium]
LLDGPDVGVDRWLFADRLEAAGGGFPNRMAPNTAVAFVGIGVSLALLRLERRAGWAQLLALMVGLLALLTVAGYAYDIHGLSGMRDHIPMALNTGVAFLAIAVGGVLARPDRGPVAVLSSDRIDGYLARRLLPAAFVVPFGLGWLRSLGESAGWYGTGLGVGLMVVSSTIIFAALVAWTARMVDLADEERARAEAERVRLNRELEERVRELDAVNRELESFAYAVSHDLRAPLRSVAGFGEALEEDCADRLDEAGRDYLRRIRDAATRMGLLIDDLLGLSRITRAPLESEPVDLSLLARRIADDLELAEPGRTVEVVIEPGLRATGDPRLLDVALRNLLGNAWKYTRHAPRARIEFGSTLADGATALYVRDNGAGFDMEYADKLFGAFQRLHGVDEYEGTGIGLATVQRIVHRHGGRVWAEGRVGEGAVFWFILENGRSKP